MSRPDGALRRLVEQAAEAGRVLDGTDPGT